MITTLRDGFVNLMARLGGDRDKASGGDYAFAPLDALALETAYRSSAMARRIVDKPAEDCAREWREWVASKDQITAIENEEKRLQIPQKLIAAKRAERLYGGSAIYIGVDNGDLSMPINPRALGKGGLRYLTVLSRRDLSAGDIQDNPREDGFGLPKWYRLTKGRANDIRIHPSRLVLFRGEQVPDGLMTLTRDGWGDSVLQTTLDSVKNMDGTAANIASLVYEAKVDIIKIPDLIQNLAMKGDAYEKLLLQRMSLGMVAKGNNGALLLDATEEYDQKQVGFSQLPELLDRFMQLVSAAAEIPMTILFGMSPAGLNATGDADIRNYYDRIKTMQNFEIQPSISILDDLTIISALGARPAELHYNWRSLWQPTQKERADTAKVLVDALNTINTFQGLSPEALQRTTVNTMIETGAFPGIEEADNEFPQEPPDPEDLNPDGNEPPPAGRRTIQGNGNVET